MRWRSAWPRPRRPRRGRRLRSRGGARSAVFFAGQERRRPPAGQGSMPLTSQGLHHLQRDALPAGGVPQTGIGECQGEDGIAVRLAQGGRDANVHVCWRRLYPQVLKGEGSPAGGLHLRQSTMGRQGSQPIAECNASPLIRVLTMDPAAWDACGPTACARGKGARTVVPAGRRRGAKLAALSTRRACPGSYTSHNSSHLTAPLLHRRPLRSARAAVCGALPAGGTP